MMPEYLMMIQEILKELKLDNNYMVTTRTYEKLSPSTKTLYFKEDPDAYKLAAKLEIVSGHSYRSMGEKLTSDIVADIKGYIRRSGLSIDDISSVTNIPVSVIKSLLSTGEGSIVTVMTILNYIGKGLNVVEWDSMFKVDRLAPKYDPITISPFNQRMFEIIAFIQGKHPAPVDVGALVEFEQFSIGGGNVIPIGRLFEYTPIENSLFVSGKTLFISGCMTLKTYSVLLEEYKLNKDKPVLYIADRVITLQRLLSSLYAYHEFSHKKHFMININYHTDIDIVDGLDKIVNKPIPITFVVGDDVHRSYLDLSNINYTPLIKEGVGGNGETDNVPGGNGDGGENVTPGPDGGDGSVIPPGEAGGDTDNGGEDVITPTPPGETEPGSPDISEGEKPGSVENAGDGNGTPGEINGGVEGGTDTSTGNGEVDGGGTLTDGEE